MIIAHQISPDYSPMLEKHRQTVFTLRDEPFSAALNKPLPCRPPPNPLQRCLFLLSGPERNLNFPLSAASMARPSGVREKKPADTKGGAPKRYSVKEEGPCRLATVTGCFKDSGYGYLAASKECV
jgi:hypothetical protein